MEARPWHISGYAPTQREALDYSTYRFYKFSTRDITVENYCLQPCSSYLKLGGEGSRCRIIDSTTSLRENVYMPDAYTNCILFGTEEVNVLGSVLCPY